MQQNEKIDPVEPDNFSGRLKEVFKALARFGIASLSQKLSDASERLNGQDPALNRQISAKTANIAKLAGRSPDVIVTEISDMGRRALHDLNDCGPYEPHKVYLDAFKGAAPQFHRAKSTAPFVTGMGQFILNTQEDPYLSQNAAVAFCALGPTFMATSKESGIAYLQTTKRLFDHLPPSNNASHYIRGHLHITRDYAVRTGKGDMFNTLLGGEYDDYMCWKTGGTHPGMNR